MRVSTHARAIWYTDHEFLNLCSISATSKLRLTREGGLLCRAKCLETLAIAAYPLMRCTCHDIFGWIRKKEGGRYWARNFGFEGYECSCAVEYGLAVCCLCRVESKRCYRPWGGRTTAQLERSAINAKLNYIFILRGSKKCFWNIFYRHRAMAKYFRSY